MGKNAFFCILGKLEPRIGDVVSQMAVELWKASELMLSCGAKSGGQNQARELCTYYAMPTRLE